MRCYCKREAIWLVASAGGRLTSVAPKAGSEDGFVSIPSSSFRSVPEVDKERMESTGRAKKQKKKRREKKWPMLWHDQVRPMVVLPRDFPPGQDQHLSAGLT